MTEATIRIRRATKDDAPILSSLNADVQRLHAEARPDLFKRPENDAFAVDHFLEILSNESVYVFIASVGELDAGYISAQIIRQPENPFMFEAECLYIDHVSVRPEQRRKGIASRLMDEVERLARERGIRNLVLDAWAFNADARRFFESKGFKTGLVRMWKDA